MNIPLTPIRFLRYAEQQFPRKTAVVCGEHRFAYAEFAERASRLSGALRAAGVGAGDRVAFLSLNCHRLLEGYYGVPAAGAVLLPLNVRLAPAELAHILNDSGAKALFLQQEFIPVVESLRQSVPAIQNFFVLDADPSVPWLSPQNYEDMLAAATPYLPDIMQFDENSLAELFYTSGTSAHPKGVMLTHRNVYLHALSVCITFRTKADAVQLHTIPLFHANGWGTAHSVTLVGGRQIMLPRFTCAEVFRLIARERVDSLSLVPIMATALVNSPERHNYDLTSVQWISIGGAASSPTLVRQMEEAFGCECFAGYGLTETSPVLSTAKMKPGIGLGGDRRYVAQAMTGYAIPGVELRVLDHDGQDIPRDGKTMGEIVARSDGVMQGYWDQPAETEHAMRDGWFHTSDVAIVDESGNILIVDRMKDIIVSGGENISSLEVEKAILAHPAVYEAAVIAVADDKWGEVPKALVIAKPGAELGEAELLEFCRSRIAHYKCPRSIEFVTSLLKTATGKILKKNLRETHQARLDVHSETTHPGNGSSAAVPTRRSEESREMSDPVELTRDHEVAIITINNPPVNALSPVVAQGIANALGQVRNDDLVKAVVLIGAGRTFIAGADIKEFAKITTGKTPRPASLLSLLEIEDGKPTIAAIHGTAFGGGLELAMAAHYRVATPTAQLGQPEVKLGIIPGAGGTQRLPRLVGIGKAVQMCAEGNPISAQEALELGLVDRLIDGELLAGAVQFAREISGKPIPRTRERNEKLGTAEQSAPHFSAARERARTKQRGMMAPLAAIDAVEAATKLPFQEGCQVEQKLFRDCLFSDQSKALIHIFFAEREVAKIPDIPKETPTIPVNSVAVVGAGTMGGGIAMVFANAGIPVLLKDAEPSALDRGLATIRRNYDNSVKRGRFTRHFVEERLQLIQPTLAYDDFARADMVVEAVFEGMALKKEVFAQLDRVSRKGAILASNTSTLDIDEIASATSRPEAVIGTHFFSPANVMRLLEIVRGSRSSKEVIRTCMQLSRKLGKIGVLVGNCRGFVGNRMFHHYGREAVFLVEEGASPQAVDQALYEFGMALGPLATGDLAGLDVGWRIRKEYRHLEKSGVRLPIAGDRLCELGRYGQKTGAGWYRYDENRRAIPDPEVNELVRNWAIEAGVPQRDVCAEEIVERCIYALVNEGARILEEGIALRAADIDIIYVNGYGFPSYRGGPMWYADTIGLKNVYERIRDFHSRHGELWEPAPLLRRLAEEGRTFREFRVSETAMV